MTTATNFWWGRRVFVTGCTGLLGPWLLRSLVEAGAQVVGLIRDHVPQSNYFRFGLDTVTTTVHGSVEDHRLVERALNEYEIEVIFHLAAQAVVGAANRSPLGSFESNIRGSWSVLEAARTTSSVRSVVVASSDKAYGPHTHLPYTEDAALAAAHPYDVSKACADMLARSYFQSFGLPVAVTRCGNLFGGGDLNFSRLVPGTIRSALHGERPLIRSDGKYVRDYFYVEDAAAAYMLIGERVAEHTDVRGSAFNFSHEEPLTVLEMTSRILNLIGSTLEPEILNEAVNEIPRQYLSAAKARSLLGWEPLFTIDDALQRTVGWYERYFAERRPG